jgi:hypothetical protein
MNSCRGPQAAPLHSPPAEHRNSTGLLHTRKEEKVQQHGACGPLVTKFALQCGSLNLHASPTAESAAACVDGPHQVRPTRSLRISDTLKQAIPYNWLRYVGSVGP